MFKNGGIMHKFLAKNKWPKLVQELENTKGSIIEEKWKIHKELLFLSMKKKWDTKVNILISVTWRTKTEEINQWYQRQDVGYNYNRETINRSGKGKPRLEGRVWVIVGIGLWCR